MMSDTVRLEGDRGVKYYHRLEGGGVKFIGLSAMSDE
jgi:hypothetical protein